MKIYGVKIKMPHSGSLTKSQALTILRNAVKNNYCGTGDFDKSNLKEECKRYNSLIIEDVNYSFRGTLY